MLPRVEVSGHVRPRQGTETCNFGAPSPLEALHWIFCFFSRFSVQFSKTSPLKSGESSEKSSGENRVESCHVCGCHGFFGRGWKSPQGLYNRSKSKNKQNTCRSLSQRSRSCRLSRDRGQLRPCFLKNVLPGLLQKLVGNIFFDFSQGNLENLP